MVRNTYIFGFICLSFAQMTGAWGLLHGFTMGLTARKSKAGLESWHVWPHPSLQG